MIENLGFSIEKLQFLFETPGFLIYWTLSLTYPQAKCPIILKTLVFDQKTGFFDQKTWVFDRETGFFFQESRFFDLSEIKPAIIGEKPGILIKKKGLSAKKLFFFFKFIGH